MCRYAMLYNTVTANKRGVSVDQLIVYRDNDNSCYQHP